MKESVCEGGPETREGAKASEGEKPKLSDENKRGDGGRKRRARQLIVGGGFQKVSETGGVPKKKSDVGRLLLRKPGVIRKTSAKKREGKELCWCVEVCR